MALRCAASVQSQQSKGWRADGGTEPRCRRSGKVEIHGCWYCRGHAPRWRDLWVAHDKILERIRSFPDRDIV